MEDNTLEFGIYRIDGDWSEEGNKNCDIEGNKENCLLLVLDSELACKLYVDGYFVVGIVEKPEDSFPMIPYVCTEDFLKEPECREYLERIYRRYRQLPWNILSTERTWVRETTPEDVDAFYRLYKDKELVRFTEDLFPDPEEERQYQRDYRKYMYAMYGFGIWTVLDKQTGEVIGRAGLTMREGFEGVELGFVFGLAWQGKGYAYEVCRSILEYARMELELPVVQAFVMPENIASIKLCRRLNMEGTESCEIAGTEYLRFQIKLLP